MSRKWIIVLAVVSLLVFLFWPSQERRDQQSHAYLPWQIEFTETGNSRVMGLEIGRSTPSEASEVFGHRGELALFADKNGTLSAESFFSEITTGGLSGRIILNLEQGQAECEVMVQRAVKRKVMDSGAIKYIPNRDDRIRLLEVPIRSLTYIPYIDLDREIIESRFGQPEEELVTDSGQTHLFYPGRGMEIIFDPVGKEVIQYVNRTDFSRLKKSLNGKVPTTDR